MLMVARQGDRVSDRENQFTSEQCMTFDRYRSFPWIADNGSNPNPPSNGGKTLFEVAVEIVEYYKRWIDWDDPTDVIRKPLVCTISLLMTSNLGELIPRILKYLEVFIEKDYNQHDQSEFYPRYNELRSSTIHDLSEFILQPNIEQETIRHGLERYYHARYALYLVDFLLLHRPCCRLFQTAWLIPAIAAGIPAIPLVAYAAEQLADFINDPNEPGQVDCTSIRNSWLHRLGIYLLHQCHAQSIPPNPRLIRLMSLVSLPPSSSVKSGKATRCSDYLAYGKNPHYLHEMPPARRTGTVLALELLGEFDANRQEEHFSRVELAVAFYAHSLLNDGNKPSVKSLQRFSGLSWSDANKLVLRPFFSQLVFGYQCRYLLYEPVARSCSACDPIGRALADQFDPPEAV
jgi:hypothetical protein